MLKNALWLFVAATIILIFFLPSYSRMQDLRVRNDQYRQQIQDLKQKNKDLAREMQLLEKDPVYLEKVARERMGLVREGEVIYKIVPVKAPVKTPVKAAVKVPVKVPVNTVSSDKPLVNKEITKPK